MAASSDSDDESFVELGKPLPFQEVEGKTQSIRLRDAPGPKASRIDQDSRGRPRFHGAFTGGFSAGYFNSVGSKEGWAPTTFVSSRQQKEVSGGQTRRPEDFMDAEDLGEHGIAPRHFATSDSFSSEEQSRKRQAAAMLSTRDTILPASAALADLIVPQSLPMGIKLLRKMGWKEGQGLGPRVKKKGKKKKKDTKGVKMYGCSLPSAADEDSESEASDIDLQNVTFAPKDVTPINLTSKDNVHGLGYRGLDPRAALPGTHTNLFEPPRVKSARGRKGIRGQGFGVGALEDEDADIYAGDSLSNYDQSMELDDGQNLFGWTAPRSHTGKGKSAQPQVPVSYVGKLLEGFALSDKPLPQKKVFPPPTIPQGYRAFHRFKATAQQLAQIAVGETPTVGEHRGGQQKLTAVERGLMLDEVPVAASVFDLIPKDDQLKLEAVKEAARMAAASRFQSAGTATDNNNANVTSEKNITFEFKSPQEDVKGHERMDSGLSGDANVSGNSDNAGVSGNTNVTGNISGNAAVSGDTTGLAGNVAASGVQPFRKEPAKHDRYNRYLALVKTGVKDAYGVVAGNSMTEWERERERDEFSRAARLYQPLAFMMASRFTRGAFIDDSDQQSGVMSVVPEKSEQAKAAEMKMFGRLTRDEIEWHPHNLLCKRFNVPNPYPESDIVGVPGLKRDKFSVFTFLSVAPTAASSQAPSRSESSSRQQSQASETTSSLTRELNASRKKKGALSIFSVLEEEEKAGLKPLNRPKLSPQNSGDGQQKDKGDAEEEKKDEDEEDAGPMDLFRAIFKNSDSESSSDSDKADNSEDSDKSDKSDKSAEEDENEEPSPLKVTTPSQDEKLKISVTLTDPSSTTTTTTTTATATTAATAESQTRKRSRWGTGVSIFDVLDQSPPTSPSSTHQRGTTVGEEEDRLCAPEKEGLEWRQEEEEGEYGPALPPPLSAGTAMTSVSSDTYIDLTISSQHKHRDKHRERDRHQHRDSSKQRHKKDKKKKSKHKKEKKKKKKKEKRSHSDKRKRDSSGSEADTETDSDD